MAQEYIIAAILSVALVVAIGILVIVPQKNKEQLMAIGNALVGSEDLLQLLGVPTGVINLIRTYAQEVVIAIEQTSGDLPAKEKKELAMRELKLILSDLSKVEKLEDYDFSILNDRILEVIIESCVFVMNTDYLKQIHKYSNK